MGNSQRPAPTEVLNVRAPIVGQSWMPPPPKAVEISGGVEFSMLPSQSSATGAYALHDHTQPHHDYVHPPALGDDDSPTLEVGRSIRAADMQRRPPNVPPAVPEHRRLNAADSQSSSSDEIADAGGGGGGGVRASALRSRLQRKESAATRPSEPPPPPPPQHRKPPPSQSTGPPPPPPSAKSKPQLPRKPPITSKPQSGGDGNGEAAATQISVKNLAARFDPSVTSV